MQIVVHIVITVVAVVGVAIKVEHRLTKIETDIGWLKQELSRINGKEH